MSGYHSPTLATATTAAAGDRVWEARANPWQPLPWGVVALYIWLFFIPDGVGFVIGSLELTPQRALSLFLFPALLLAQRARWTLADALAVGYLAVGFASFSTSESPERAAEAIGRQALDLLCPYLLGRWLAGDAARLNAALRLVLAILAACSVFAVIESVFRLNVHREFWQLFGDVGDVVHQKERMGVARAKAWASHPIMLGFMYAGFLPFVLYGLLEPSARFGKQAGLATLGFLAAVIATVSSGAWIAVAVVFALSLWEHRVRMVDSSKWLLAWTVPVVLYFLLEVASGRPLLRLAMMKLHVTSPGAWRYRWQLYTRVQDALPGHEWLGYGLVRPESFRDVGTSVDNHFLLVLLLRGYMGLTVWLGFIFACLFCFGRSVWFGRPSPEARLARTAAFGFIALALAQLSAAIFSSGALTFWFLGGLLVGLGHQAHEAQKAAAAAAASASPTSGDPLAGRVRL